MSHKRLVFTWQKNFQEVIHPQIFFVIYLYLDASAKRIFKQKNSLADLMHSHISKSDHSATPSSTQKIPVAPIMVAQNRDIATCCRNFEYFF